MTACMFQYHEVDAHNWSRGHSKRKQVAGEQADGGTDSEIRTGEGGVTELEWKHSPPRCLISKKSRTTPITSHAAIAPPFLPTPPTHTQQQLTWLQEYHDGLNRVAGSTMPWGSVAKVFNREP